MIVCFSILVFAALPMTAYAYVGPGADITLLTTLWTVAATVFVIFGGMLLWPFRILWRKLRQGKKPNHTEDTSSPTPKS